MGKASSNKKVARAAGTGGGRTAGGRIAWGYYGVIALVVILGVAATYVSRHQLHSSGNKTATGAPAIGTTWNEAYAVDICGKLQPNITVSKDPQGIHTQGDGIIHIRPTSKSSAGKNATLGKFADAVGMKLNSGELQIPGGRLYRAGDDCNGHKAKVYVQQFPFAGSTNGTTLSPTTGQKNQVAQPGDVHLQDQAMLVIAFVQVGKQASVPPPDATVQKTLTGLGASSKASAPPASNPATATTTQATTPASGSTATTVPATSGTSAPGTTAPATTTATTAPATTAAP